MLHPYRLYTNLGLLYVLASYIMSDWLGEKVNTMKKRL